MRKQFTRLAFLASFLLVGTVVHAVEGGCTLALSGSVTNETCPYFFNGSIDVSVSGQSGSVTYAWSTGDVTQDLNSIASGSYVVTATDQGGCVVVDTFVVTDDFGIDVFLGNDTTLCNISNYVLVPDAPGATFFYWQNGSTLPTHTVNAAGEYWLFAQNSFGCSDADTINIFEFPTGNVQIFASQPGCGDTLGSFDLVVNGATPPFAYTWSTGDTVEDIQDLLPGSYWSTVVDSNGCVMPSEAILLPDTDMSGFSLSEVQVCTADAVSYEPHSYAFNSDGVNDYLEFPDQVGARPGEKLTLEAWIMPMGVSGAPQVIVEKRMSNNNGLSLLYDPVLRRIQCRVQNGPYFSLVNSTGALNTGVWAHVAYVLDGQKAFVYINGQLSASGNFLSQADSVPGTPWRIGGGPSRVTFYGKIDEVRLWNNSLTAEQIDQFRLRPMPQVPELIFYVNWDQNPSGTVVDAEYPVGLQGSYNLVNLSTVWEFSDPMGLNYFWKFGDGIVNNLQSPTHSYAPGAWTDYSVILQVETSDLCRSRDTLVLPVHVADSPLVVPSYPAPYCNGDTVQLLVQGQYTSYLWSNGYTRDSLSVWSSGTYAIAADDGDGCIHEDSIAITIHPAATPRPVITADNAGVLCQGDTLLLDVGPGYFGYLWSNGATSQTVITSDTGAFVVTVTNGYGCFRASDTLHVVAGSLIVPTIANVNDTLFTSWGATYQWYLNGVPLATALGPYYVPSVSGVYSVFVTQPDGCGQMSPNLSFTVGVQPTADLGWFSLYPNPSRGTCTLGAWLPSPSPASLSITDLSGRRLWEQPVQLQMGQNTLQLPVEDLPAGSYLLEITLRTGRVQRLLVRQ